MQPRRSRKREYDLFIENAIESYKDLISRKELLGIGDEAIGRLERNNKSDLNELLLCDEVDRIILKRLELPDFQEWRKANFLSIASSHPIIDSSGMPVSRGGGSVSSILVFAEQVSDQMIAALSARPELLFDLGARKFEEVIAELLHRSGAQVSLTPTSRDGGRDIIARISSPLGAFLCLVECKKYSAQHPVGVRPVRELFGVISHERVSKGILVTTSRFSKPAVAFQKRVPHQLSLRAYSDIVQWLEEAARSRAQSDTS